MNYLRKASLFVLALCLLFSCKDDDSMAARNERLIEYFAFEGVDPAAEGEINHTDGTVRLTVPFGTNRSALQPTIRVSEGASIDPPSGEPQDFRNFAIYTVTGADGLKKTYTVLVAEGLSNNARLTSFKLPTLFQTGVINQETNEISLEVFYGTDLSALTAALVPAETGATISPSPSTPQNFSQPVTYTVTAPDGQSTETYTVRVSVLPEETGIRGVWITNVDSDVLNSQANIQAAVDRMAELNLNTAFVVTYNKALTTYPSQVMKNLTGVEINPLYAGRDPLREFIDAAHAKNIKVFAWFEYGFAANNGSPGPILQAKPNWGAINNAGNQVVKNGFYWLNSLHPEVQEFMTELVLETVRNYPDMDGVQGDDRLPAMPTEGGYDAYTVEKYKAEHNGQAPPNDPKDGFWIQWRANILNAYGQDLYNRVKAINPSSIVAMSPSPMNFGLVEYLQDYPAWVKGGYADLVSPQLYRRDTQGISIYRGLLSEQLNQVGNEHVDKFYPGILSYLGGYVPDPEFMVAMVKENRRRGVTGEVHFFYNALLSYPEVFRAIYPAPAIYPNLLE
ncbi:family 10 glycosylhydrolase [Cesiribacter andamanensis]|uniref:Glycosyl hydrolase-like 10 domain-containing protein n=1 Tax=Cesiribacter andamanensis AMV16 TaxID=1279009 RepID=M7N5I9_9BACT|nr:family 10 glycosylhydrolase [Cesiribacter andamanensis]EMR02557.1 hypothetical protein ADICEAN_02309 [Cesiribacter andamanensis AMV16]